MSGERIPAPQSVVDAVHFFIRNQAPSLFPSVEGKSLMEQLTKASEASPSSQGVSTGRKMHPFDRAAVVAFQSSNIHHASCLFTKTAGTVGLGFQTGEKKTLSVPGQMPEANYEPSRVDEILNPLCEISFADVLNDVAEDFWQTGDGYMEVVRESPGGPVTGLHHIPAAECYVFLENEQYDYHFEVVNSEGTGTSRHFAKFNDSQDFIQRAGAGGGGWSMTEAMKARPSEVIRFRRPSSRSRWYGYPDWLGAVPAIELTQCVYQFKYDFFLNRGVPEFMLFILGAKLSADDWKKVEDAVKANIGMGNSHKSLALNIPNPEVTIQVEKLAMESKSEDGFDKTLDALALNIVSAHRVPPLLAGILIPGKLGATNELANALMATHVLVLAPAQRLFHQVLASTLGDPSSKLGLTAKDFRFRRIVEEIDLGVMDTVGRMRQQVPEANASGRDLTAGVKS